MQNYVHRTRESAVGAPAARLVLAVCRLCGFAWNRAFEPDLLVYDEHYDNLVPSAVMDAYYAEIVEYLDAVYSIGTGLVVDVGCGDGRFLRALCGARPDARGLGIDPSLGSDRTEADGRLRLIDSVFRPDTVAEAPALVVSRHVLEHIHEPVEFVRSIGEALAAYGPRPCFFEVPDLEWIVAKRAFWDFCYEHCNYFTARSFAEMLRRAGLRPTAARNAFGGQYLWIEAESRTDAAGPADGADGIDLAEALVAHAAAEAAEIASVRARLEELKRAGARIAVWGMATKGVLFSILVDPEGTLVEHCIDLNEGKHGSYVPITGHLITGPEDLARAEGDPLAVVVMNENYREEIERQCADMGVAATFHGIEELAAGLSRERGGPGR